MPVIIKKQPVLILPDHHIKKTNLLNGIPVSLEAYSRFKLESILFEKN